MFRSITLYLSVNMPIRLIEPNQYLIKHSFILTLCHTCRQRVTVSFVNQSYDILRSFKCQLENKIFYPCYKYEKFVCIRGQSATAQH